MFDGRLMVKRFTSPRFFIVKIPILGISYLIWTRAEAFISMEYLY